MSADALHTLPISHVNLTIFALKKHEKQHRWDEIQDVRL